ncbi:MAG: PKD domain-containing protein [Endomicrobiia bacterium]
MKKSFSTICLFCLLFLYKNAFLQTFQSIQISNCDTSSGWTATNLIVSSDNNIYIEGRASVMIQAAPTLVMGGWGWVSFTPQITNFSVAQVLSFWLYLPDNAGRIKNMEVVLYDTNNSSATWSYYYKVPLNEWQFYTFWLDKPTSGNVDLTSINRITLRFQQSSQFNIAFNLYIDDIRLYSGYSYEKFAKLETRCEIYESLQEKAAQEFIAKEISPWIDITNYISLADKARGFVEIGVLFYGSDNARWKLIGDDDAGAEKDLRAYCDGIVYELKDSRYKHPMKDVVYPIDGRYTGAVSNSWIIFEFLVPDKIQDFYKLYIGNNFEPADLIVDNKKPYWMATYYKAEAYVITPLPGIYANINVKNVTQEAKWEYDPVRKVFNYISGKYVVTVGSEVEFDASESVVHNLNTNIVSYNWDFGDNTKGSGVSVKHLYSNVGVYKVTLTLGSSDGKTFPEYPYAKKSIIIEVVPAPIDIKLYQNGPNPFDLSVSNPFTKIKYELSEETEVTIKVFSMTGKVIKTLIDKKTTPAGSWEVVWDGKSEDGKYVESGLYFYALITPTKTITKKMLVLR